MGRLRFAVTAFAMLGIALVSCGGVADEDIRATWKIEPAVPAFDQEVRARLILRDEASAPVRHASVRIEAHMAHPGMAPVVAVAREREAGVYEATLALSMAGSWTLVAEGTLADGRRFTRTRDIRAAEGPPAP